MENHFELFQLPQRFGLDLTLLGQAYREVQGRVHPDRFVNAGGAEQRVAMQWATRANEAYQTLKDPLRRAAYLCELRGLDVRSDAGGAMPVAFLMQQMEWREALEQARAGRDMEALQGIDSQLRRERKDRLDEVAAWLDAGGHAQTVQAAQGVRALMFLEKFAEDVSAAFEALET